MLYANAFHMFFVFAMGRPPHDIFAFICAAKKAFTSVEMRVILIHSVDADLLATLIEQGDA